MSDNNLTPRIEQLAPELEKIISTSEPIEYLADGFGGAQGPVPHVPDRVRQRPTHQLVLVRLGPRAPHPGHHRALRLEPERLGVHQQPVHVEQDGTKPAAGVQRGWAIWHGGRQPAGACRLA